MLGASQAMRRKAELPITSVDAGMIERHISCVRPTESSGWDADLRTGAGWTVEEALDEADRAPAR